MIEIKKLSIKLGKKDIVDNLNLTVKDGETLALVGRNGSGKTTLLRAVMRNRQVLRYTAGEIFLDGTSAASLSSADLAKKIAVMPQILPAPSMSVFELVMCSRAPYIKGILSRPSDTDKRIVGEAISDVGLSHLSDADLSTLSGGERQSAYFAMLLAQRTSTVLLDEPTSNLDYNNKEIVYSAIDLLKKRGISVIAVLHNLEDAVRIADRILLLDGGRGYLFDTPADFINSDMIEKVFSVKAYNHNGNIYFK